MSRRRRSQRRHPSAAPEIERSRNTSRLLRARRGVRTAVAAALIIPTALFATWTLVRSEIADPTQHTDWVVFGIVAVLAIAVAAELINGLTRRAAINDVVVRTASTALSLSTAGLVIAHQLPDRRLTSYDQIDGRWAALVAVALVLIVLINAATTAIWTAARRRSRLSSQLRHGLAARITAEGSLVSFAPIWVAGIALVPLLVPLLAMTTVLVFIATRQALEQMHESRHDQLTGLLNRLAFLSAVEEATTTSRKHGASLVMLMDLNGFKDINDRLGHHTGDALLVAFADRLERSRPGNAEIARLGGDEFAVLVRFSDEEPDDLVERLHHRLTRPLRVDGFPITAGVSIGVAVINPGQRTSEVMRAADSAMYKAKRTVGTWALYEPGALDNLQHGRYNLLSDLSKAIDNHELYLNFQPQLRLDDGTVDALEALVRWEHPEYGPIKPSEFIGLAEQTDLIEPITEMVLRTATQGFAAGQLTARLAVNVVPRSLENSDFVNRLISILDESGFPPGQLELEMTERAMVRDPERTSYAIKKLRAHGVRIAIDDFGVGYSSYQTLRLFDVDRVKIDSEFVQGLLASPRDGLIVSSLIKLAHDLGLDVVAEGVESTRVWEALQRLGCDVAQGFGIAVPMDYVGVRHWLKKWDGLAIQDAAPALPKRVRFATLPE